MSESEAQNAQELRMHNAAVMSSPVHDSGLHPAGHFIKFLELHNL